MKSESRIIGIDFGTTISIASVIDEATGRPDYVKDKDGLIEVDSVVWYQNTDTEKVVVGGKAKRACPLDPDHVFSRFKPGFDDPDFKLNTNYSPEEVTSEIFKYLKANGERQLGVSIEKTVITTPAWLGHLGRQRIQEGAKLAGLKPVKILAEPVAAAIAYSLDHSEAKGTICVFDFGGGTLDVSIVDLDKEEVKVNYGDLHCGGKDLDQLILEKWQEEWKSRFGVDPLRNPQTEADWRDRAERVKKDLSTEEEVSEYLTAEGESATLALSRDEFEKMIIPYTKTLLNCVQEAMDRAEISTEDVDEVVLVGGSTRIPKVKELLSDYFGRSVDHSIDPSMAVAMGAGIVAGDKEGISPRDILGRKFLKGVIEDVTAHGLGVEVVDGDPENTYNHVLIASNTKLPARGKDHFQPLEDDSEAVLVTIIEGDDKDISKCKVLQENYKLEIPNPRRRDLVDIEIEFVINTDGIIEIHAYENSGGELHEQFRHPAIVGNKRTKQTAI